MLNLSKKITKKFSTLIIPDSGKLSKDVSILYNAAKQFNEDIQVLQLCQSNQEAEEYYKNNNKLNCVVNLLEHQDFEGKSYELASHVINKFFKENKFNRVIMGNSFLSKELLPRLSVQYDCQAVNEVVEIVDNQTFKRPIYAGNALSKVEFKHNPLFLGIRLTNFEPAKQSDNHGEIKVLDIKDYEKDFERQIKVIENKIQKSDRPELVNARVIFSGGRALKSKENFDLLYKLSDKVDNSAVGASRAAVDAGYCPNDLQIGQTGKIVAPDVYFAFGISGAIQHIAGIKDSKVIVAVNKNDEEPIFEIADYGLKGDIFKIIPELTDKIKIVEKLKQLNQTELIKEVEKNENTEQLQNLWSQLEQIDSSIQGGLDGYQSKAEKLNKKESAVNTNSIKPPLNFMNISLNIGKEYIGQVGFVLVAGGLGERLGSSNIKISLVCESVSRMSFMDMYLAYMEQISKISGKKVQLFIMTSDDTHDKTIEYLKTKNYENFLDIEFGKQQKVPSYKNFDLQYAYNKDTLELQLKPHGHGDVHSLLKKSNIYQDWISKDQIKYLYFFQDTNPFSLACLATLLGVTIEKKYQMNFLTIKRKPGEAVGAIISDENNKTYCVEYNVMKQIFQENGKQEETDDKGFSKYPGNSNCFLLDIKAYDKSIENLDNLKDFVNPKKDKQGNLISSFRLECLMQDIALCLQEDNKVGATQFYRALAISAAKNNLKEGMKKQLARMPSETIIEVENDIYYRNYLILRQIGVEFQNFQNNKSLKRVMSGIQVNHVPRIFIHPSFGIFLSDIKKRIQGLQIDVSENLFLLLKDLVELPYGLKIHNKNNLLYKICLQQKKAIKVNQNLFHQMKKNFNQQIIVKNLDNIRL